MPLRTLLKPEHFKSPWGRIVGLAVAWVIIISGLLFLPLPTPFGLPLLVVGATVLLTISITARRVFIRLKRRYPITLNPLRALLRRRPRPKPAHPDTAGRSAVPVDSAD